MNDRSSDGTGSFEVKIRTKTAKFTKMIIAKFRESRLFGQRNVNIGLVISVCAQSQCCGL